MINFTLYQIIFDKAVKNKFISMDVSPLVSIALLNKCMKNRNCVNLTALLHSLVLCHKRMGRFSTDADIMINRRYLIL